MKFQLLPTILIAITLSVITSKIAYFGFNSNLMANVFSQNSFRSKFGKDVYKYRILSSYLLVTLDNILSTHISEKGSKEPILIDTKGSTVHFYYAFYYLNTFFLTLASVVVVLLLHLKNAFTLSIQEKHLFLFTTVIVINFSQFIICPYDISSYFFHLFILYIFIRYVDQEFLSTLLALSALIIISTLNRESSALSVAAIILLAVQKWGSSQKTFLISSSITICFIATYAGLRYIIPNIEHDKIFNPYAGHLLLPKNMTGMAFWGLFLFLPLSIASNSQNRWLILYYHILCSPYIYTCLKDGALLEIRLYIPLFIYSIFLSKLRIDHSSQFLSRFNLVDILRFRSK